MTGRGIPGAGRGVDTNSARTHSELMISHIFSHVGGLYTSYLVVIIYGCKQKLASDKNNCANVKYYKFSVFLDSVAAYQQ